MSEIIWKQKLAKIPLIKLSASDPHFFLHVKKKTNACDTLNKVRGI